MWAKQQPEKRASADGVLGLRYVIELFTVAIVYGVLAKSSLAIASINPSASPIWPPTGFALATVLLLGYRVWPAILAQHSLST